MREPAYDIHKDLLLYLSIPQNLNRSYIYFAKKEAYPISHDIMTFSFHKSSQGFGCGNGVNKRER